jgi:hypothetical protein
MRRRTSPLPPPLPLVDAIWMLPVKQSRSVVMRSPCAGAAIEPPFWIIPNNVLSHSLSRSHSLSLPLPYPFRSARHNKMGLWSLTRLRPRSCIASWAWWAACTWYYSWACTAWWAARTR